MPLIEPTFIALDQTMYEKSVTNCFTSFSILETQGDPLGQSSPFLTLLYSKAPSINLPNIVMF